MNQQQPNLSSGYRSRYLAYINQEPAPVVRKATRWARLIRGLLNFAIFVALFLALLTLFGFWLSRAGRGAALSAGDPPPAVAQAAAAPSPSPAGSRRRSAQ